MGATGHPPLVGRAYGHGSRLAVVDDHGAYPYDRLLHDSAVAARTLLGTTPDLQSARVAIFAPRSYEYVLAQWAIWRAGAVAVPLCESHPLPELEYVFDDADVAALIVHPSGQSSVVTAAQERGVRVLSTAELLAPRLSSGQAVADEEARLPVVEAQRAAMIVYTSGTSGRPKGVVSTHANLRAQICSLVQAWEWTADDRILCVLPLHHVHGIVNVLASSLWSGATCEMLTRFDPQVVWERFAQGQISLFMAVPTIYRKLIAAYEQFDGPTQARLTARCKRLRLMISGSAPLPVQVFARWQELTGHVLLERYGMTEIGMALGNPVRGERRPGFVGSPLPGVELRLCNESGAPVVPGSAGQIQVRGPQVFKEYWRQPAATKEAFVDGWFLTGDIAALQEGSYKLLGRQSIDIIKTGGFKVSALEIETALRDHPAIEECAVVGLEDPEWGERVAVAVELREQQNLTLKALRQWAKQRLAPYKVPSALRVLTQLPRNAMGKVNKPAVRQSFA